MEVQCVNFLGADIAGKDRRSIRRNIDLRAAQRINHPAKTIQVGERLDHAIGESKTLGSRIMLLSNSATALSRKPVAPMGSVLGHEDL